MELIFHWMAHGCILSDGMREVEDVGDDVWNELAMRSFFQEIDTSGGEITFKMHDLVHDLAQYIMENKVNKAEPRSSSTSTTSNSKIKQVRWSKRPETSCSSIIVEMSTLTTIINYNRLRSLKLFGLDMKELPRAIVKLKQLRYLDLSYSSIHCLPRTFCRLNNLQTLKVVGCLQLKSLPKNIIYMSSLRHIDLKGCSALSDMPNRIGELACLKTLSLFIVGPKIGNQVDELEHLNLGGRLEIKHLEHVKNHMDAKKANLKGKPNLRHLILRWDGDSMSESTKMMDGGEVLEALEPAVLNLTILKIDGFKCRRLASWMKEMKSLTRLTIRRSRNCRELPPLGYLPRLKKLSLAELDVLEYIQVDAQSECPNSSIFPSLEELKLLQLPNLKGLFKEEGVGEIFPNLRELSIMSCHNLTQLGPLGYLPLLKSLYLGSLALEYIVDLKDDIGIGYPNSMFPSLEELTLSNLPNLKGSLKEDAMGEIFPNLQRLAISECPSLILRSTLVSSNLRELSCGARILPSFHCTLSNLSSLSVTFGERDETSTTSTAVVEAGGLRYLKDLWVDGAFPKGWLRHLSGLKKLWIYNCREFEVTEEEVKQLHLLQTLELHNIRDMESLPHALRHLRSLQRLKLFGLHNLTSLPEWLPDLKSLTDLEINYCPHITSLPSTMKGITS